MPRKIVWISFLSSHDTNLKFFPFFKTRFNSLTGGLEPWLILIAVAWHAGLVTLERRLNRNGTNPSVRRLLFTAELELLRSLRAELKRMSAKDADAAMKLFQVEERLRELGEYG